MSASKALEGAFKEILAVVNPLNDDWIARHQILEELKGVVASVERLRGATVEPFGSFVSNLFSRWGDLDISIELANESYVSLSGKKHRQQCLRDLLKAIKQRGTWKRLQFISNARVPILKFESHLLNISCDISIDNLHAQMKSKILLWLNQIDGRFRDIVLLVKEWAKAHNINNSKSGTFNSYSLSLLVVFHFQTCSPAIFPPLKDIYPGNIADDLKGVRADAERHISETCLANINRFRSNKQRMVNRCSLSQLFISFLAKFSDISLQASDLGICTFTGKWEDIKGNMRWLPQTCAIYIEDPFEQPENCARAVNSRQLTRISEIFVTSHYSLLSANQELNSLLPVLAPQQTIKLIPRPPAPAKIPSYHANNYYQTPRPQWQRNEQSYPQKTRYGGGYVSGSNGGGYVGSDNRGSYEGASNGSGYIGSGNSGGGSSQYQQIRPPPVQQRVQISYSQVQPPQYYQSTRFESPRNDTTKAGPYVRSYKYQGQQTWRQKSNSGSY
ncbi:hypothetical protein UlMin_025589 [Ulmus minor]